MLVSKSPDRDHDALSFSTSLRRWGFLPLLFVSFLSTTLQAADLEAIEWLAGASRPARMEQEQVRDALAQLAARPMRRYVLVQFDTPVGERLKTDLATAGMRLNTFVGSNAYFAWLSPTADVTALARVRSLASVSALERTWKLHPMLHAGEIPAWAVVEPADPQKGSLSPIVGAYILFHPGVTLDPEGVNLALQHRALVRSKLETVNGLVIELPFDQIPFLAEEDGVQWIEPPLPRMEGRNDSNRVITGANVVQASPYGLNGSGVTVLVYDAGFASASHPDFGGRLTVRDSSGLSGHATHVSGTVGGSGVASGGTFRGMAPAVIMQSYGFDYDGSGIFLYSNPGDIEDDYDQAINTFGADISNNSIGTNTCANGFPCTITGDYGVTSALIDSIVSGSLGTPFRVVWANGNERGCPGGCQGQHQNGYHSTAPPACAKNHLTVGALNSNDDTQTSFSSWGPCDDGRLKPDVSGPGCQSNGDGGVTSCSSGGGYSVLCGTSMASPTVCGLSSLLLQDFRVQFPGEPDFRNSTLRTLLAHTAQDRGNAGPDFQFGFGSVRIQPAVDFMRTGNFLENSVAHGAAYSLLVVVAPGDPELKVTLAWDDPAAAPAVTPSLVNDLDLVVFDPSSVQQFPWTLNPAAPSTPAVRTQADNRNNIEQVYVANPTPGAWRVEIRGFNVPMGPQAFSVAASPLLVNCSTQGVVSLDRAKYPCEGIATIQVVDCDLNADDSMIETIAVTIESDSEPAGESVILTETAAETSAFRGTINLSATDALSVLLVTGGDVVTARYIDADDGFGGVNVVVETTAPIDCQGPVISNVQTTGVGPFTATATFNTDELAQAAVRYGPSCGALTNQAAGSGFNAAHSVALTGLSENSNYFYAVDALDQAGNDSTNDNGGGCYAFSTPDIPNYFTEQYGGDNDLDNLLLTFEPDGSFDFYHACAEPITALPVDPTGGTVITFASPQDDAFVAITLAGGSTVKIYGNNHNTFYVSTNGYVTFTGGSTEYEESLAEHFSLRRVAALFDDLHPGQGGSVSWKQLSDRAVVTWQGVPEYNAGNSNTFQIDLGFDGTIRVSYLAVAAGDGISGLSAGGGLPSPFFESDQSGSGACCEELDPGPEFVRQPGNVTICEGSSTSFAVLVDGSGAVTYQWQKDSMDISGAQSDQYVINNVQTSDAGIYAVEVTDSCGTRLSDEATLTVLLSASCDDNNPCTNDNCLGVLGCVHLNASGLCDDGLACTVNDTCTSGACAGDPIVILFGDIFPVGGNGVVDIDDIVCVLLAFVDDTSCDGGDVFPCGGGNGLVDGDDIIVVLDAFVGSFACPHPCPP